MIRKSRIRWHVSIATQVRKANEKHPARWNQLDMTVYATRWRLALACAMQEWERHPDHGKGYRGKEIVVRLGKLERVDLATLSKGEKS